MFTKLYIILVTHIQQSKLNVWKKIEEELNVWTISLTANGLFVTLFDKEMTSNVTFVIVVDMCIF